MRLHLPALLVCSLLCSCGRQERTISITSEPSGAIVWLNDYELGRTPVDTEFTFFGVYDIRLTKDGYEPLLTSKEAVAPIYEYPGIDLIATAIPGTRRTRLEWHFDLTPLPEASGQQAAESALLDRARQFRDSRPSGPKADPEPAPKAD